MNFKKRDRIHLTSSPSESSPTMLMLYALLLKINGSSRQRAANKNAEMIRRMILPTKDRGNAEKRKREGKKSGGDPCCNYTAVCSYGCMVGNETARS